MKSKISSILSRNIFLAHWFENHSFVFTKMTWTLSIFTILLCCFSIIFHFVAVGLSVLASETFCQFMVNFVIWKSENFWLLGNLIPKVKWKCAKVNNYATIFFLHNGKFSDPMGNRVNSQVNFFFVLLIIFAPFHGKYLIWKMIYRK